MEHLGIQCGVPVSQAAAEFAVPQHQLLFISFFYAVVKFSEKFTGCFCFSGAKASNCSCVQIFIHGHIFT